MGTKGRALLHLLVCTFVHAGCGYTQLERIEQKQDLLEAGTLRINIFPSNHSIGFFDDSLQVHGTYVVIDTLRNVRVPASRNTRDEELLHETIRKALEMDADAIVNFKSEFIDYPGNDVPLPPLPNGAKYVDGPRSDEKIAHGTLIKYRDRLISANQSRVVLKGPAEFYYSIELRNLKGKVLDRLEYQQSNSYTIPSEKIPDGIYAVSFVAMERESMNSWTNRWKATRWIHVMRGEQHVG
ncbi:MAG: hypothetical protein HY277_08300 [Ignavibacteriales bacterium]|nr:hypothetical protein [Ignavibacteriales bacterium]